MKINGNICSCMIFFSFVFLFFVFSNHMAFGSELVNIQGSEEVKIISNPKTTSPKDGKKIRIVFEEELPIGVEEGDENYMFGGRVYSTQMMKGIFMSQIGIEKESRSLTLKGNTSSPWAEKDRVRESSKMCGFPVLIRIKICM